MIIFAWKVNNPLSFLISLWVSESLNHFSRASQFPFSDLKNKQKLFDKLQSHNVFFTLVLMFSLLFWSSDGTTQALGTCLRDFRNKPYPIRAKITYYKKTLTVGELVKNSQVTSQIQVHRVCLSSGDDQQWLHSKQRRLWVLHKGGKHGHSFWRLLRYFGCHWWFSRYCGWMLEPGPNVSMSV